MSRVTPEDVSASEADEDEEDLFQADDDEEEESKSAVENGNEGESTKTSEASPMQNGTAKPAEKVSQDPPRVPKPTPLSPDAPIPRLSAPAPASTLESSPATKSSGNKYGLPADVVIPSSVSPTLLQGRLLETLRGLPKQLINDALAEYDDAVQIKGESIRNHGAYLYGVVKRYVSVQERATSGEGEGVLPMGPELTPAVNERLGKLVSDGFCTETEMNEKVRSKIRMLSEKDALFAIEELSSVDRSQIRNFGSYFMGILNRYMRGERKEVTSGRKTLAEVRQSFQQQSSNSHRNDDRRRDDRYQRGQDSEPQYRRTRDDTTRRDRSRDRYDMAGGHREPHAFSDQYDPRNPQQRPPYLGQPPMVGNPPPPPPRPPGMSGGSSPYQQGHPPRVYGQNPPSQMQPPYGQQPPNQPYAPPQMGGPTPGTPYGAQHIPPQQRGAAHGGQPPPNQSPYGQQQHFVSQQNPYGNSQQGGVPSLPPMQATNLSTNSYGVSPNHQPPYMNQQQPPPQQQSYANSPYASPPPAGNRYSQPGAPPDRWGGQGGMQNAPQLQASAVDILALADKASSAVQALQSQSKFSMSHPSAGTPSMQHQPPPNAYQAGGPPQPYGQPPMSAPQPYPPINQPYGQQQPPPQLSNQSFAGEAQKRRRTTAGISELPVTVQYAVQNLQATGQIDGPLDDGMLGMVKDLPEGLALQALQKFSSIDKHTMRNKTAYLAGVLRRELEKIHRR